jgi:PiT family inorganic phosphate transporter
MIALLTIKKGLKHIGLDVNGGMEFVYAGLLGLLVALVGVFLIRRVKFDKVAE